MMSATEYVILVDEKDQAIGTAEKMLAHQNNLLHRAFSVFIFRKAHQELELLLQQRALSKYHSKGLWTNTCCSHPTNSETILKAGERRLSEELRIHTTLKHVGSFHYNAHFLNGLSENEIDHVLIGFISKETKIIPNVTEVHDYRWITIEKLQEEIFLQPDQFTPWLEEALNLVIEYL